MYFRSERNENIGKKNEKERSEVVASRLKEKRKELRGRAHHPSILRQSSLEQLMLFDEVFVVGVG